jgi:hypothetical protein
MGLIEFDEFPFSVPPLDDDPFISLSTTDLMVMEAATDNAEDGSDSRYEEEEDDDE